MKKVFEALVEGIHSSLSACGFNSALLGLSGGLDSALVATLAKEALGKENVWSLYMPSPYSSPESLEDAKELSKNLGIRCDVLPITNCFQLLKKELSPIFNDAPEGLAEENMQARLRGIMLMSISNKMGGMVLSTGNKSEICVGYCTLYGDTCGGLAVINDLYKTEVYRLSYWINEYFNRPIIPIRTLTRAPSAELRPNQKDQDSLPAYEVLDAILKLHIEEGKTKKEIVLTGFAPTVVDQVISLFNKNKYKQLQMPPGLSVRHLLN
jgi:NAD+ synthetase